MSRDTGKLPPLEAIKVPMIKHQKQQQQQQQRQSLQKTVGNTTSNANNKKPRPSPQQQEQPSATTPKITIKTIKLERPSDFDEYLLQEADAEETEDHGTARPSSVRMQPLGDNTINVPAFLGKLWKMVNDPDTDHLISWNSVGNSFVIQNQAQFWYELLPVYYKHNNMSSFVRQLNMYGFHKVSCVENGTMDADRDEIVFYHPYFQRGRPELLRNIKRKVTGPKSGAAAAGEGATQGAAAVRSDELDKVLVDVKQIRGRQAAVDSQLSQMKQENAVLWRELALLRQKHLKQQQIVNKLIHFLLTLVQPHHPQRMGVGAHHAAKRRYPLMLCEKPSPGGKRRRHPAPGSGGPGSAAAGRSGRTSSKDATTAADEETCPQAGPPPVIRRPALQRPTRRPSPHQRGPTIHELDPAAAEAELSPPGNEQLYEEMEELPLVDSPPTSVASSTSSLGVGVMSGGNAGLKLLSDDQTSAEVMEELSNEALGPDILWDKSDLIRPSAYIIDDDGEIIETLHHLEEEEEEAQAAEAEAAAAAEATLHRLKAPTKAADPQKVFLNPSTQDTLLSNLIDGGSYNQAVLSNAVRSTPTTATVASNVNPKKNATGMMGKGRGKSLTLAMPQGSRPLASKTLAVATKENAAPGTSSPPAVDELHSLVGSTQNDLDQLKDMLAGCNGLDANALLGLFGDAEPPAPDYGLGMLAAQDGVGKALLEDPTDPMVSGNELSTYGLNMIDFNELFGDDSVDGGDASTAIPPAEMDLDTESVLNTPQVDRTADQRAPSFQLGGS